MRDAVGETCAVLRKACCASEEFMTEEKEEEEQEEKEKQTGVYCGGAFRVEDIRVWTMHAGQKGVRDRSGGAGAGSFRFYSSSKGLASSREAE